jgi:FdhD protein
MANEERQVHPEAVRQVQARRISTASEGAGGPAVEESVCVAVEAPLKIDVEGVETYTLLCTPGDRRAMAIGFLFSEGVIDGMADVASCRPCRDDPDVMRVKLREGVPRIGDPGRNLLIVSSCGACGSEELQRKLAALPTVGDTLRIDSGLLRSVSGEVRRGQALFDACGGTHAVGIFDREGEIVAAAEDTGRHHALDKAVGKCLLAGASPAGCGAVLSGRVSLEMVGKCARAGIELITAISAPTSLAIEVAERCEITLCAFVRETRATVFTHPGRVLG